MSTIAYQLENFVRSRLPGWEIDLLESRSPTGDIRCALVMRARKGNRCIFEEVPMPRRLDRDAYPEIAEAVADALRRIELADRPAALYIKA